MNALLGKSISTIGLILLKYTTGDKKGPEYAENGVIRKGKDSANRKLNTLKPALNRALNDRDC